MIKVNAKVKCDKYLEMKGVYDMMIYGYGQEGKSYKALRLITEMGKSGLVPNVASYELTIPSSLQ
jgi:pentatricopeptide repeat protein